MIAECKQCHKGFYTKPARIKNGRGKFCSLECRIVSKRNHFNQPKKIKYLYLKKKKTLRQIAKKFHCSPTSIKNCLIQIGVARRDSHDRKYPTGKEHPRWKGGKKFGGHVYEMRIVNGRVQYVHRLVIEELLGRKLKTNEEVHHIDRNPKNNNLDNLILLTIAEHRKLHAMRR